MEEKKRQEVVRLGMGKCGVVRRTTVSAYDPKKGRRELKLEPAQNLNRKLWS